MMWWISIALGLVSALLHWPIVEERLIRPAAIPRAAAGMTMAPEGRLALRAPVGLATLLVAATVAVSFVMWGPNGPAYLIDLIAAYCL